MSNPTLVQKLWDYYSILRDDGFSYGDYVEQLIPPVRDYCLQMADEAFARGTSVRRSTRWQSRPGSVVERESSGETPLPL